VSTVTDIWVLQNAGNFLTSKELCFLHDDSVSLNQLDMSIFIYTRMYEYACEFDAHESVHRGIIMNSTNEMQLYRLIYYSYLDNWLTVHRSITLVDLQLDVQNSYLFTYNIFIKILYMFRAVPCSSSGGLRRKCIYAVTCRE